MPLSTKTQIYQRISAIRLFTTRSRRTLSTSRKELPMSLSKRLGKLIIAGLALTIAASCAKKSDDSEETISDSTSNAAESAGSAIGSIANETENGTLVSTGVLEELADISQPQDSAYPLSVCTWAAARSCSSGTATVSWNSCKIGLNTLTGGWTSTYNPTTDCSLSAGESVTRTSSTGFTITFVGGATLTTSTEAHVAWNGTSIPSTGVVTSTDGSTRTVTINGLHRVLKGPRGRTWFDHSLTGSLSITGTKAAGTRTVTGTMTLYHNRAQYTAAHTFNNVKWGSSTCPYPTSGSITSTLTGSVSGSATLTYSSTCGSATFTDTSGSTSSVALSQPE
jgi:hypothetical protein